MKDSLKGKRLLLLGSSVWKDEISRIADEYGITLIVAGNKATPLDDVADEVYRVDSTDHEAMKQFITTHNIDGVLMGGSELIVTHASQYLNELGYPCYCTKEQWDTIHDKSRFKALCQQFGLPVAKPYEPDATDIVFPVVTKPVDGSGGIGISICHNAEEMKEGYAKAKAASRSGRALIEQFEKNNGIKVIYTFSEGKVIFTTMATKNLVKYTDPEAYVFIFCIFESNSIADFRSRYEEQLTRMFAHLGIKEGTLWIEVFKDGDNYCFNEAHYRYMGQISIYPVEYFTGINQLAADITFALTGESRLHGHIPLIAPSVPRKKYYCMYCPHLRDGRIASITGFDEFRKTPENVYSVLTKAVGDEISGKRTVTSTLGSIHLVFDNIEEFRMLARKFYQTVHVTDCNGQEMLMENIDWEDVHI